MKQILLFVVLITGAYAHAQEPVYIENVKPVTGTVISSSPSIDMATAPQIETVTVSKEIWNETLSEHEALKEKVQQLETELETKTSKLNQAEMECLEYQLFLRRIAATIQQIEQSKELEQVKNFIKQIKSAILEPLEKKR